MSDKPSKRRLSITISQEAYDKLIDYRSGTSLQFEPISAAIESIINKVLTEKRKKKWVYITSYDGNGGDLETYVDMPFRTWEKIRSGEKVDHKGTGGYEGEKLISDWHFKDGMVTIGQESKSYGWGECAIDKPIEELHVDIIEYWDI